MVLETAVNGHAHAIVTFNDRHLGRWPVALSLLGSARIRMLASSTIISTGRNFFAPATPLLEVGRNFLFTHAGKSRSQAIGRRLELPKIRRLYTLRLRGGDARR
jgi:hypothetical protein